MFIAFFLLLYPFSIEGLDSWKRLTFMHSRFRPFIRLDASNQRTRSSDRDTRLCSGKVGLQTAICVRCFLGDSYLQTPELPPY